MSHTVSLSWTASTDKVDGYNVYKGAASGSEATLVNTGGLIAGLTFVDSNATLGSEFYAVKSSVGGVESVLSNSVDAVVLPAAPTNLVLVSVT